MNFDCLAKVTEGKKTPCLQHSIDFSSKVSLWNQAQPSKVWEAIILTLLCFTLVSKWLSQIYAQY